MVVGFAARSLRNDVFRASKCVNSKDVTLKWAFEELSSAKRHEQ